MMASDSLGDRVKRYEAASATTLPPRLPIIIRVDGKAFHTWTRGCAKPFDAGLMAAMDAAAIRLCEVAQTTQLAYVQSDEITLVLHPYKRFASQPWFGAELQKMVSVAASVAAAVVTQAAPEGTSGPAFFDGRAFVVPPDEVANVLLWRQQDATRNSVQMLARSIFSHRECDRKTCDALRAMCAERGQPWEGLTIHQRLGRVVLREAYMAETPAGVVERKRWATLPETPSFGGELGRALVRGLMTTEDEEAADDA